MKPSKRLYAAFAAALVASALGCAATSTHESTGAFIDDTAITTKVKSAIFNEPSLKVGEIKVETNQNVVTLSGVADTRADIDKAVALARAVPGVSSVENRLQLK